MPQINYNERSWAIDVISEINLYLANKSWHVKSAGGENTIRNEKSSLFPDVLIFKDSAKKIILQGWELKMPDPPITDTELINNAKIKSEILHNNSFILWNVTSAVLYVKKGNTYSILKSWNSIDLHSRSEVKENEKKNCGYYQPVLKGTYLADRLRTKTKLRHPGGFLQQI